MHLGRLNYFTPYIMKSKVLHFFLLVHLTVVAQSQDPGKDTFRLFFLGGQSNMEGHGLNADLPDSLKAINENVWIFHGTPTGDNDPTGGMGKWEVLKPGNGAGYTSDGKSNKLSHKFGPELSFGKRLAALYPGQKIAIIKYARGGSSIDSVAARQFGSWEFDFQGSDNQLDYFLKTVNSALSVRDINGDGREDVLIPSGIIWMQGESDAVLLEEVSGRYEANLKRLMDLIRATFRDDDLPVVIGKISDSGLDNNGKTWTYGELVQHAQEEFVRKDRKAAMVRSTKDYKYSDPWHYDSYGYIDLGIKFAEAVYLLNLK